MSPVLHTCAWASRTEALNIHCKLRSRAQQLEGPWNGLVPKSQTIHMTCKPRPMILTPAASGSTARGRRAVAWTDRNCTPTVARQPERGCVVPYHTCHCCGICSHVADFRESL